jgi:hypothetical protein
MLLARRITAVGHGVSGSRREWGMVREMYFAVSRATAVQFLRAEARSEGGHTGDMLRRKSAKRANSRVRIGARVEGSR